MSYQPQFTITAALLARVESIAALRERIQRAAVQVPWIPALQKDTRARNTHSSTAIEGNPLTLEEVRALEDGTTVAAPARARREVLNYFAALRHVEKHAAKKRLVHEDIFRLHAIIAGRSDGPRCGVLPNRPSPIGSSAPPAQSDESNSLKETFLRYGDWIMRPRSFARMHRDGKMNCPDYYLSLTPRLTDN